MMAALQLKNVQLGPTIAVDQPGLIQLIYALLIVANCLMFGAALALIKPCVKLFSLPHSLLMTLIIPICVIGAYSVRTNMFDVWVMVAGGFLGYAFYMFKFPAAPMVLGIILAPLADENLRRALLLFDNNGFSYFAHEYIGHGLVVAIALIFFEGLRRGRRSRKLAATAVAPSKTQ
jgi:putative tricarboxylic transport membrane protein